MCVSPNLVAGAWVGGEYRSIHFRTGALGQGSRTALPITGYFMQAVLGDPAFNKYHGKFDKPKDDNITQSMYICNSYVPVVHRDTTRRDSTVVTNEEIILDEDGNPIEQSSPAVTKSEQTKATEPKPAEKKPEKKRKTEETVNFDDL